MITPVTLSGFGSVNVETGDRGTGTSAETPSSSATRHPWAAVYTENLEVKIKGASMNSNVSGRSH
ncbi:hypothetical protein E4U33_007559 [Claviceps sp. LM78 group G4]|nr:hypothetical protein E4U33_007559 [Claviceps sp. LM78 group G4]